jgi:hypothetical protein
MIILRVLVETLVEKGLPFTPLIPKLFDPWLKGALVPVHLKMWVREH